MKKLFKISLVVVLLLAFGILNHTQEFTNQAYIVPPQNFTESKKIAAELFSNHRITFYCGCQYNIKGEVNWHSCGYKPKKNTFRATHIEWEHIVPAHFLGKDLPCWKHPICKTSNGKLYKGRKCCQKVSKAFIHMEADLHNLVPEIGELNAARSNYAFGLLPNKSYEYGACQIKIDTKRKMVEPRPRVRGTIARAYLYMSTTYKISLTDEEFKLFNTWDAEHPPEKWEIEWYKNILKIQENHNFFTKKNNSKNS